MKVGIEVQIDVTKIEKARLFQGKKGKYLTMTTFVDLDVKDQYDNNGFISHKKEQDEQNNTPILGNVKVFWTDGQQQAPRQQAPQQQPAPQQQRPMPTQGDNRAPQQAPQPAAGFDDFDDDIPFN